MSTSRRADVATLVIAILLACFAAAYLGACAFDVVWLKDLLVPQVGKRGLPFPWNLIAILALIGIGFLLKRTIKRGK